MHILRSAILLLLCSSTLCLSNVYGATIISENGPVTTAVNGGLGLEVSWTSTATFTNVTISMNGLSGSDTAPGTDTFFLTTQIGAGTTTADEIASNTVSVGSSNPTVLTIFTGLTLTPGSYFLVIGGPFTPAIFWSASDTPTVKTAPGVTFTGTGVGDCGPCTYVPAANFDTTLRYNYLFDVSDGTVTPIPEPSSVGLLLASLFTLVGVGVFKSIVRAN